MGLPRFGRPKGFEGDSSPNLYVANCGPAVGLSYDSIASVFSAFGELKGVFAADDSGARVIVSYRDESSATAALEAFDGHPCPDLGGRSLHIRYSVLQPTSQGQVSDSVPVSLMASELNIPGLYLLQDFVTIKEEETRNVNTRRKLGELPSFVSLILERISSFPNLDDSANIVLDQLTVNEYPTGVGLSPHVDTHSAFEGFIFSLSLAGPCIMEFRQYAECAWLPNHTSSPSMKMQSPEDDKSFLRRAIYLPPRSMLLLSGEARYAWHHYIPHHKIDLVKDSVIRRGSRRVSFTFRKVRTVLANVNFPSIVIPRDEKTGFILVENQSRTIQCSSVYVPTIIIVCRKSLVLSLDSRATRLELDSLSKMIHSPSFRGSHRLFLRLTVDIWFTCLARENHLYLPKSPVTKNNLYKQIC
ncbi:alkylated DNA repair protein ALKBH8 homolog isoform X5 [Juglans microcarpa x Juglans regia]|uniref:alkylated DNA repair protein ALKBH8 homolog isoform X5 n=1 Tax=Juglans microcarpa x Juglans regia TaxID=2249226 RepID=UPI001B7EAAB8|nr:alkylated DNA repair protein ALKBH8 homolog isoform X5 [Juglans microcarpa x Juglans regia]